MNSDQFERLIAALEKIAENLESNQINLDQDDDDDEWVSPGFMIESPLQDVGEELNQEAEEFFSGYKKDQEIVDEIIEFFDQNDLASSYQFRGNPAFFRHNELVLYFLEYEGGLYVERNFFRLNDSIQERISNINKQAIEKLQIRWDAMIMEEQDSIEGHVELCFTWARENGLKRVTKADLVSFMHDHSIEYILPDSKNLLYSKANIAIKSPWK